MTTATIRPEQLKQGRIWRANSVGPGTGDDSADGYKTGDIWINEAADKAYILLDATVGAALWYQIANLSGLEVSFAASSSTLASVNLSAAIEEVWALWNTQTARPDGWKSTSRTWTYASADAPVYQIYVSGDVSGSSDPDYKLGNKVKCTNNSTTVYGFIVKLGAFDAGNNRTPVDLYLGTDYTLANSAITAPYISKVKSPDGFPLNPDKWTVSTTTSDSPAKSSPTASTWYGGSGLSPTGPSISIPIGAWRVIYSVVADYTANLATAANVGLRVTLSTANNSESDPEFTRSATVTLPAFASALQRGSYRAEKVLTLTSKTTYYVNMFAGNVAGTSPALTMNSGGVFRNLIRAVCAYL